MLPSPHDHARRPPASEAAAAAQAAARPKARRPAANVVIPAETLLVKAAVVAVAAWSGHGRVAALFAAGAASTVLLALPLPWAVQCLLWWSPILACAYVARGSPSTVAGLAFAATAAASTLPDNAASDVHVLMAAVSFALVLAHVADDRWRARARWEQWAAWILAGAGLLAALPAAVGTWGNVRYANVGACIGIATVCLLKPRKQQIR